MSSSLLSRGYQLGSPCILLFNRIVTHKTATIATSLASKSVISEKLIDERKSQSKESEEHEQTKQQDFSTKPSSKEKIVQADKQPRMSTSFVMNLFRGQLYPDEVFPYPNVLNEEQKDNVHMLVDPIWRFFDEKNDAAKNDQLGKVIAFSFSFSCLFKILLVTMIIFFCLDSR